MIRRSLLIAALSLIATHIAAPASLAQATGLVHFHTHLPNQIGDIYELGVMHTFVQGSNGLVETFTQEFTAGTHTLARIDAQSGRCRLSAINVTFTVVAGQWNEVDVPVTYQDCSFHVDIDPQSFTGPPGGTGIAAIAPAGNGAEYAHCETEHLDTQVHWVNYDACQATVPFTGALKIILTPDQFSSGGTAFPNSIPLGILTQDIGVAFTNTVESIANEPTLSFITDLDVKRISSSVGGQVAFSTFRVLNKGPNIAKNVVLSSDALVPASGEGDGNLAIVNVTTSAGSCRVEDVFASSCMVTFLGIGDSMIVTMRVSGRPNISTSLPTVTPHCSTVHVTNESGDIENLHGDPDTTNNVASCVSSGVPATIALGGSTPASHTVAIGATHVPMIEFAVNPTSTQTINSVTVAASGSGNEQVDVTAVKLYVDKNGNGQVDAGDTAIASGTFAANNGTVVLAVAPGYSISAPTNFLVTYDFSTTLAERLGGGLTLAMFPLLFLPAVWRRKRVVAMIVMAMLTTVALTACGSDSTTGPPPGESSVTYQTTITGMNISGTDLANVSLAGATITIDK